MEMAYFTTVPAGFVGFNGHYSAELVSMVALHSLPLSIGSFKLPISWLPH